MTDFCILTWYPTYVFSQVLREKCQKLSELCICLMLLSDTPVFALCILGSVVRCIYVHWQMPPWKMTPLLLYLIVFIPVNTPGSEVQHAGNLYNYSDFL